MTNIAADFRARLAEHAANVPAQAALAAEYEAFASTGRDTFTRANLAGHFTGSAFVVSADGELALLLYHAKLQRWLQPGGHADGDTDLARVALREAEEETGISGLVVEADVFDLDRHAIPARGAEPEHLHWDVRYVVRCSGDEAPKINSESRAFAWRRIDELEGDDSLDPSIRRMAARWLQGGRKRLTLYR
jgi:8-oxo-dGTP pyrophosphatase MutT (NUDIX family)